MNGINLVISGEGTKKEVEWSMNQLGIAIPLSEIIAIAEREFPNIPIQDLIISGYTYEERYGNGSPDESGIKLRHKENL
jgi:hypothetical protein